MEKKLHFILNTREAFSFYATQTFKTLLAFGAILNVSYLYK